MQIFWWRLLGRAAHVIVTGAPRLNRASVNWSVVVVQPSSEKGCQLWAGLVSLVYTACHDEYALQEISVTPYTRTVLFTVVAEEGRDPLRFIVFISSTSLDARLFLYVIVLCTFACVERSARNKDNKPQGVSSFFRNYSYSTVVKVPLAWYPTVSYTCVSLSATHQHALNTSLHWNGTLGPVSILRPSYLRMGISMLKIRRPLGRLIFNMGIVIPGKTVFLIETAPWCLLCIRTSANSSLMP